MYACIAFAAESQLETGREYITISRAIAALSDGSNMKEATNKIHIPVQVAN